MPNRPATDRKAAEDRAETQPGHVFGQSWWGLDRDRLEDELARAERARDGDGEAKPH